MNWENPEQIQSIVLEENGTCTVDDESPTWETENEQEKYIDIKVYEGKKERYMLSISEKDSSLSLALAEFDGNGGYSFLSNYINLAHYDVSEITEDNWKDYLEIVEQDEFRKNSFGEVEDFNLQQKILLKEEYVGKLHMSRSKLVMELSFTNGDKEC